MTGTNVKAMMIFTKLQANTSEVGSGRAKG